jgi:hypothetical protein
MKRPPSKPLGHAGIQRHQRKEPEADEEIDKVVHDSTLQ